jgi:flagellar biosynthesis protein FlhA
MISISGALIVTRASSEARLGAEFHKQILGNSQPIMLAGGVLMAMAAMPGMPLLPFLVLGCGAGAAGWKMRQKELAMADTPVEDGAKPAASKDNVEGLLRVEPLAIEVGLGLIGLVEGAQESPLLRRISAIRRQLASELGYLLPPVRVTDNLALRSREYIISLKGVEISRFRLAPFATPLKARRQEIPPSG